MELSFNKLTSIKLKTEHLLQFLFLRELDSEVLELEEGKRSIEDQPKAFPDQRYWPLSLPQRMARNSRSNNRSCCRSSRIIRDETFLVQFIYVF